MYYSPIPGAEHKVKCQQLGGRKGRARKSVSTDIVSVTIKEETCKGREGGRGIIQVEREKDSVDWQLGRKGKSVWWIGLLRGTSGASHDTRP